MADSINVYKEWLGIPSTGQLPHHYELLGLTIFEEDPQRIKAAYEGRFAHVRKYEVSNYAEPAIRLLSELSLAYNCLSDADRKVQYDEQLRLKLGQRQTRVDEPSQRDTLHEVPKSRGQAPAARQAAAQAPARQVTAASADSGATDWLNMPSEDLARMIGVPSPAMAVPQPVPVREPVSDQNKFLFAAVGGGALSVAIFLPMAWFLFRSASGTSPQAAARSGESSTAELPDKPRQEQPPNASPSPEPGSAPETDTGSPAETGSDNASRLPLIGELPDGGEPVPPQDPVPEPETTVPAAPSAEPAEENPPPPENSPGTDSAAPALNRETSTESPTSFWDQLPDRIDLPETDVSGWQPLIFVPTWLKGVEVSIVDTFADLSPGARFQLQVVPRETPAWRLVLQQGDQGSTRDAAYLMYSADSGALQFRWAAAQSDVPQQQLRNCKLRFAAAGQQKDTLLRTLQPLQTIVLNLELDSDDRRTSIPLQIAFPPRRELLFLEIDELIEFPSDTIAPTPMRAKYGDDLALKFGSYVDVAVVLKLVVQSDNLAVSVAPEYAQRGSRPIAFSPARLEALGTATVELMEKKAAQSRELELRIPSLESDLRSAQASRTSNQREVQDRANRVSKLNQALGNARGQLRRNLQELPILQARAAAVPGLIDFARQLHGNASVRCRVMAVQGEETLLLVGDAP